MAEDIYRGLASERKWPLRGLPYCQAKLAELATAKEAAQIAVTGMCRWRYIAGDLKASVRCYGIHAQANEMLLPRREGDGVNEEERV